MLVVCYFGVCKVLLVGRCAWVVVRCLVFVVFPGKKGVIVVVD